VAAYLAVAPRAFRETEDAALEAKAAGNGADDVCAHPPPAVRRCFDVSDAP